MELAQSLFQKLYKKTRDYFRPPNPALVQLSSLTDRFRVLACAIAGQEVEIIAVDGPGGFGRNTIFLPQEAAFFEDRDHNLNYYRYRVSLSSLALKTGSLQEAKILLSRELPGLIPIQNHLEAHFPEEKKDWLQGQFFASQNEIRPEAPKSWEQNLEEKKRDLSETTIQTAETVKTVEIDEEKIRDYALQHHFEKLDTAEEFLGNWRNLDGEDELKDHEEALQEIRFDTVVRLNTPTHAITQADMRLGQSGLELAEEQDSPSKGFFYDEWSAQKRRWLKDWCCVYEKRATARSIPPPLEARVLKKLEQTLKKACTSPTWIPRQEDGPLLDLNAFTDFKIDLMLKKNPSARIHLNQSPSLPKPGILILADLSLSTDAWIQNQRVLDTIILSCLYAGETLNRLGFEFEIAGFSSQTRKHCEFHLLHERQDNWKLSRRKIAAITPNGYTRIGPSLRHAKTRLSRFTSPHKALLLLTDAKPSDYDRYEGFHGIRDVARACLNLRQSGIHLHCLSLDPKALSYLPLMLGSREFELIREAQNLGPAMVRWIQKLSFSRSIRW